MIQIVNVFNLISFPVNGHLFSDVAKLPTWIGDGVLVSPFVSAGRLVVGVREGGGEIK